MKAQSVDATFEKLSAEASEPGREFVFIRCKDVQKILAHVKGLESVSVTLIRMIHEKSIKRSSEPQSA